MQFVHLCILGTAAKKSKKSENKLPKPTPQNLTALRPYACYFPKCPKIHNFLRNSARDKLNNQDNMITTLVEFIIMICDLWTQVFCGTGTEISK